MANVEIMEYKQDKQEGSQLFFYRGGGSEEVRNKISSHAGRNNKVGQK